MFSEISAIRSLLHGALLPREDYFAFSIPYLPRFLWIGLVKHKLSSINFSISVAESLFSSCLNSHVGILWIQLQKLIVEAVSKQAPQNSPFTNNLWASSSRILSEPWCYSCFVDMSIGTEFHIFVFYLVLVFCNGLHYLQRDVYLMKTKIYLSVDIMVCDCHMIFIVGSSILGIVRCECISWSRCINKVVKK